ncbi:MAG TPA: GNAT family N-acetyltransferase [Candidatus Saccharibacteria bacterium]|nr:GNAT family N-acetyltransferase [Candidatus Saccharibacteria bacterium]
MKIIKGDVSWTDTYAEFCQPIYQDAYAAPGLGIPAELFSKEEFEDESTMVYFRNFFENNTTWLALDDDGTLLGGIGASDTDPVHLSGFYVAVDKQGKGIGRELFNKVLEFAAGREIELDVMRHRTQAIEMYEHLGFEIDKTAPPRIYGWQYPSEEGRLNGSGVIMRRKAEKA